MTARYERCGGVCAGSRHRATARRDRYGRGRSARSCRAAGSGVCSSRSAATSVVVGRDALARSASVEPGRIGADSGSRQIVCCCRDGAIARDVVRRGRRPIEAAQRRLGGVESMRRDSSSSSALAVSATWVTSRCKPFDREVDPDQLPRARARGRAPAGRTARARDALGRDGETPALQRQFVVVGIEPETFRLRRGHRSSVTRLSPPRSRLRRVSSSGQPRGTSARAAKRDDALGARPAARRARSARPRRSSRRNGRTGDYPPPLQFAAPRAQSLKALRKVEIDGSLRKSPPDIGPSLSAGQYGVNACARRTLWLSRAAQGNRPIGVNPCPATFADLRESSDDALDVAKALSYLNAAR